MMHADLVYAVPAWVYGLGIVFAAMLASVAGQAVLHRFTTVEFRAEHTTSVTAIFSIIGVTYAVLLAFVAMLTWESFNKARAATFDEAGAVAELHRLAGSFAGPVAGTLSAGLDAYVRAVVDVEWPAQARGHQDLSAEKPLQAIHTMLGADRPADPTQSNLQARFLDQLATLSAARQGRLLAVQATVPTVVWAVVLAGGAMLIGFSSLLGARSYLLHMLMTAALSASGALVIVLIVSLDNPFRSDFSISADAFTMQSAAK